MYILDKDTNQLITAEPTTFKEQKLKERQHLQEWIAKNPEVLGEELLVIQKEFDGFSDTHERLDLLALDKDGKHMSAVNNMDMLPVEGHDVSEITLYVCDYNEYMDEIKGQQLETDKAKDILDEKALWSGVLSF